MVSKAIDTIADALTSIASIALILMMVLVGLDVSLKYFLNQPVPGTTEIVAYYLMVTIVFLPLAHIERTDQAITIDIFFAMMPRKVRTTLFILSNIICALFFIALAYRSYFDTLRYYSVGEMVEGLINVPVWPGRIVLPVSFTLCALVNITNIIDVFRKV